MKFAQVFGVPIVAPGRLRQEIFALGGRYHGEALAGALHELKDPSLSADRRHLLRAVVRSLMATAPPPSPPPGLLRGRNVAVIAAVLVCLIVIALNLLRSR